MTLSAVRLTRRLLVGGLCLTAGAALAQDPPARPAPKVIPPAKVTPPAPPPNLPVPEPAPFPAPAAAPDSVPAAPGEVVTRYTLGEALALAHSKHPQLTALKASMNAALLKERGLGEVKRTIGFLSPDIGYREKQSDLGIKAAMAEYEQGGHDVTYAVVRCYYTVVYAREQAKVARDWVEELEGNLEQVRKIVEGKGGGVRGVNQNTLDRLEVVMGYAKKRLLEAEWGTERARAALREAMGLEPGCRVDVADEMLPEVKAEIKRETVVAHAVTRRGEVLLTQMGVDVTRLEVCAQWSKRFGLMAATFANAADIHARPVPGPEREPDYKPGAIGPEMPDRLIGRRDTRAAIANEYAVRAGATAAQARSLVGLEAEVAHARWGEADANVRVAKRAAEKARQLREREKEAAGGELNRQDILINEISSVQALANLNQALYDQVIALANLERITAGGVRVNFPGR